ncbi:hypothetical protein MHYP_G00358500 [Metynnis hypsauchen]
MVFTARCPVSGRSFRSDVLVGVSLSHAHLSPTSVGARGRSSASLAQRTVPAAHSCGGSSALQLGKQV